MAGFLFRRASDDDLRGRLDELERAHRALAREHESSRAAAQAEIELLTLLTVPPWLRDARERAQASGWIVACSPKALVFERPDAPEHSYSVELPLPDDEAAVTRLRQQLQIRVFCFEQRAA